MNNELYQAEIRGKLLLSFMYATANDVKDKAQLANKALNRAYQIPAQEAIAEIIPYKD